jgi:hypothetical protein
MPAGRHEHKSSGGNFANKTEHQTLEQN